MKEEGQLPLFLPREIPRNLAEQMQTFSSNSPSYHPIPVVCIMRCKRLGASNEDTFLVVFVGNVLLNFI